MSREFPVEQIINNIASPGDGFVVIADMDLYDKNVMDGIIHEIREEHAQFIAKISRLTEKYNVNIDIKTIVIADEHSQGE